MDTASSDTAADPTEAPLYASFAARVRAWLTDFAVLAGISVLVMMLGGLTRDVPGSGRAMLLLLVGVPLLYEPILVSRYGATVGHRRVNLRVVADRSMGNPSFARALLRFLIKALLGVPSFISMAFTTRHQAIHDSLTSTTVQLRDPGQARPGDFVLARLEIPSSALPSRTRRVVVSLAYLAVLFLAISIASALAVSGACIEDERCTSSDDLILNLLVISWMAASLLCIIAGMRGLLPGARARQFTEEDRASTA